MGRGWNLKHSHGHAVPTTTLHNYSSIQTGTPRKEENSPQKAVQEQGEEARAAAGGMARDRKERSLAEPVCQEHGSTRHSQAQPLLTCPGAVQDVSVPRSCSPSAQHPRPSTRTWCCPTCG